LQKYINSGCGTSTTQTIKVGKSNEGGSRKKLNMRQNSIETVVGNMHQSDSTN